MKRITFVTLVVVTLLGMVLSACATQAPTPTKVTVATDATFPPFETVDEKTSALVGFDIDLMNKIAEKAGLTVEWTNTPFDSVLAGLESCQYDAAIAAITITPDRQAKMLFSDAYLPSGQIVVVRTDETKITGLKDLTGMKVAAQLGTTGEIEAQKIDKVNYRPYDTYDLAFLDLANGQVDAVIADYPTALGFIGKNPGLKTVGDVFTSESYGIAICKTKTDLQTKINTALQALVADGTVKALETKWIQGQ